MKKAAWMVSLVPFVWTCQFALAQTQFKVAYDFGTTNGIEDGAAPNGGLVFDRDGNMYGTTRGGGNPGCGGEFGGCGTVFQLSPNGNGTWKETVIHRFCDDLPVCSDGFEPWAGLTMDRSGNLYGTTVAGGTDSSPYGTAFELSRNADGTWNYTKLWNFDYAEAWAPYGKLVLDQRGNLYGTTYGGGVYNDGSVFELSQTENGWTKTTLHSLSQSVDGQSPYAGVAFDKLGNLYGTTYDRGDYFCNGGSGCGSLFELSPNGDGTWRETFVFLFNYATGGVPWGEVNFDGVGNLYTSVSVYGPTKCECGGIVRMSYQGNQWQYSGVLAFHGKDGAVPLAGVSIDRRSRVMYGTTHLGGKSSHCGQYGCGTVYAIKGTQETVLHNFCSQPNCTDGEYPWSSLFTDGIGNLYGSTWLGGTYNYGVVFEITP